MDLEQKSIQRIKEEFRLHLMDQGFRPAAIGLLEMDRGC